MKSVTQNLHHSIYGAIIRDSRRVAAWHGLLPGYSVEDSRFKTLRDPETGDELTIIGTCNMSYRHACVTREFLRNYKPTSLLCQASDSFLEATKGEANMPSDIDAMLDDSGYHRILERDCKLDFNIRNMIFWFRKSTMKIFLHTLFRTPADWTRMFYPHLETKWAIDVAKECGAELDLMSEELSDYTYNALQLEKDMDFWKPLYKYLFKINENWAFEIKDFQKLLRIHSLKTLSEEYFHKDTMAWGIRVAELLIPQQKKIFIDRTDYDFFLQVENVMKGERKVALVNQWHMDGIEYHWRKAHGIENKRPATTGTEDLFKGVLASYMDGVDADRELVEKLSGDPLASHSRQQIPYNEEGRSHYG